MEIPVKICGPAVGECGKVKPVLPSYAAAAFGDGALVYVLAIHTPFLTFSLDKADLCCPEENMSFSQAVVFKEV